MIRDWAYMAEIDQKTISAIRTRMQDIREWMADEALYVAVDQRQLDDHTPERAYWHLGYQAALKDVLDLIEGHPSQTRGSADTSN